MRSDLQRAPLSLKIAAAAGLAFLHLPILLIFVYAFTTEEKSYQWPPPGFTTQWLAVTWNRPDVWQALGLSVQVASISTAIALVLGTPRRQRLPDVPPCHPAQHRHSSRRRRHARLRAVLR